MKKLLVFVAAVMISSAASAQYYDWAIGIRGGFESTSLSVKRVFSSDNALEALIGWSYSDHGSGFNVTGLYEFNVPVIGNGFRLYYGLGGHVGNWKYKEAHKKDKNDGFNLGVDAVIGFEYSMRSAPLAFSIDWKPRLDFTPSTEFLATGFAIGVKYTF